MTDSTIWQTLFQFIILVGIVLWIYSGYKKQRIRDTIKEIKEMLEGETKDG